MNVCSFGCYLRIVNDLCKFDLTRKFQAYFYSCFPIQDLSRVCKIDKSFQKFRESQKLQWSLSPHLFLCIRIDRQILHSRGKEKLEQPPCEQFLQGFEFSRAFLPPVSTE